MKQGKGYLIYISMLMLILLIPFVGMAFPPAAAVGTEKQDLQPWPDFFREDGTVNLSFLSDMGGYFQDHFAFRPQIVMSNAVLKNATVKSGAEDQVIIGRDGWLFFDGTLNDYLGRELLSARERYAVVHNISLIQAYVEEQGSRFLLTVAPNKNSVYGQYMPYNYLRGSARNSSNLTPMFKNAGIAYADLFALFGREDEELYFKGDSHWNNKGAALVYDTVMDALGKPHEDGRAIAWETRIDHIGDLDEMLYLLPQTKEPQYYPKKEERYAYVNEVKDTMDSWIETVNAEKTESLLMYRDSFGESLVPFFAEGFGEAYFSRLVPYNLVEVEEYQPDYVVLEIVERNLIDFVARAAIVPGQTVDRMNPTTIRDTLSTIQTETDGPYLVVKGVVDGRFIQDESDIYVSITSEQTGQTSTYQTMYLTNEAREGNRYCVYIDPASLPEGPLTIQLIVSDNNSSQYVVRSENIMNEQENES